MRFCFTASLFYCFTTMFGQSISLPGVVVIQNSEYETGHKIYVSGASIRAPHAKAVTSDKDGQFALAFAGVESGTPTRITVAKPGMEVVNSQETEQVILGREPQLIVVMADTLKLAEARAKFYNIATEGIARGFDRKMSILCDSNVAVEYRLAALTKEMDDTLATLGDAMTALSDQRDAAMKSAPNLAREFSLMDLDEASALYREAYGFFSLGEIDSALLVLSKDRLDRDYANALTEKERASEFVRKANTSIRQVFEAYDLKRSVLLVDLRLKDALLVIGGMLRIAEQNSDLFGPQAIADLLRDRATVNMRSWKFSESLIDLDTCLLIRRKTLGPDHPSVAEILLTMSEILTEQGRIQEADSLARAGIRIFELTGHDQDGFRASALMIRGGIMVRAMRKEEALGILEQALTLMQATGDKRAELAGVYGRMAMAHMLNGDIDKFFQYEKFSMAETDPRNPDFYAHYYNMACVYRDAGELDEALLWARRMTNWVDSVYGQDHPLVARGLGMQALILLDQGLPNDALAPAAQGARICEAVLSLPHEDLHNAYKTLGNVFADLGSWEQALSTHRKALSIIEELRGPNDPQTAMTLASVGYDMMQDGRNDEALVMLKQAEDRLEQTLGDRNLQTLTTRSVIGEALLKIGRTDEAERTLEQVTTTMASSVPALSPALGRARRRLGSTYMTQRKWDKALSEFEMGLPAAQLSLMRDTTFLSGLLADIGRCHFERSELAAADSALSLSSELRPASLTSWYLYKAAIARGNEQVAIERLIFSVRTWKNDPAIVPGEKQKALNALKTLATKLHRHDILQEFHLE